MKKENGVESINGNESVEDLIAMVNRQDNPNGVIAMICMTTRLTNPATFNQFKKELKNKRPDLYEDDKLAKLLNFGNNQQNNNSKTPPAAVQLLEAGCFIATATLGDYNHPVVIDLRNFRDLFLLNNIFGRAFVRIYYFFGPFFARLISKFELLRLLSLNLLIKPLHNFINKNLLK